MIKIVGSANRSFIFPAGLQTAFEFYTDMERTLTLIPHVTLMEKYQPNKYRMLYSTKELGNYRVRIFCNLETHPDHNGKSLRVMPLEGAPIVKNKIGMYSLTAQGLYSSVSKFKSRGLQTEIEYSLKLTAELPIPLRIRFMPIKLLNDIAHSITQWRMDEIVEGFVKRSLKMYREMTASGQDIVTNNQI
jgi:hypothetical protein